MMRQLRAHAPGDRYRPQWPYSEPPAGFEDEVFILGPFKFNFVQNGQVALNLPINVEDDAEYFIRAIQFTAQIGTMFQASGYPGMLARLRDCYGNPLSEGLVLGLGCWANQIEGVNGFGFVFEPEVECPPGGTLLMDLQASSNGAAAIFQQIGVAETITFEAAVMGPAGNAFTIALNDTGIPNEPFSIAVVGGAVSVNLQANAGGVAITTFAQLAAALNANAAVQPVMFALLSGSNPAEVVAGTPGAMALAGGANGTEIDAPPPAFLAQIVAAPAAEAGSGTWGELVAVQGNYMAVGLGVHNHLGNQVGTVSIYQLIGGSWQLIQTIEKPNQVNNDQSFGDYLTFIQNAGILFISESNPTGNNQGKVYVYTLTGGVYVLTQTLTGNDGAAIHDLFGRQTAAVGDTGLLIAAPTSPTGVAAATGFAYYFTQQAGLWVQVQKFQPADVAAHDHFSTSLAAGPTFAVFQSPQAGPHTGVAYAFQLQGSTWVQVQKFTPPAGQFFFGYGVYITPTGNYLVLGGSDNANTLEFAQIWKRTGAASWSLLQTITRVEPFPGFVTEFAGDTSIVGNDSALVIGANSWPGSPVPNPNGEGQAYIYALGPDGLFALSQTLDRSPALDPNLFGAQIAALPDLSWIMIGSPIQVGAGAVNQEVYAFRIFPSPGIFGTFIGVKRFPRCTT